MIDSELLFYLIVFSETGSLLKSSELLHLSQPSLSRAMQKLEAELDLTLFDRSANKITLNENGKEILSYAKDIMMMMDHLKEKAKTLKEKSQSLNIGLTAPGPIYQFPTLFVPILTNKKISVMIEEEAELVKKLINNIYDLIFINRSLKIEGLVCEKIMREHLYVSVPTTHFLAKYHHSISFNDIDGQTFLLSSDIGQWNEVLDKHMKRSRFLKQDDLDELREIAEYSTIPNFVTNVTMSKNAPKNRINIPIADDDAYLDFYVLCKKERAAILDLLKQD